MRIYFIRSTGLFINRDILIRLIFPFFFQWPILTLGDGLGTRKVLLEDSSLLSGAFVVEESESDDVDGLVRRLVFMATPHLAQTEVLMKRPGIWMDRWMDG